LSYVPDCQGWDPGLKITNLRGGTPD